MIAIVGLGNPDRKYHGTRHNIGFQTIDYLSDKYNISVDMKKHKGLIGKGIIDGQKVLLVKPMTYMNLSGECLRQVMDYYKLEPQDFIVIYDDISLDVGQLRIRKKGSAGGHNGIKSIISHLGSMEFPRIKIGVGEKPKGYDLADYVLGHFTKEELAIYEECMPDIAGAVELMVWDDIDKAMNQYNKKNK
ncbi:MAG: aminoacyl-tRNA hydrolase [Lachnospiraceae bacterium]|nr:aminoacyl-tRNA hydrolase [Lachnospiraceae bacterium]